MCVCVCPNGKCSARGVARRQRESVHQAAQALVFVFFVFVVMLGCVGTVQFVLGLVARGGPGLGLRGARAWARGGPGLGLGSRGCPGSGLGSEGPALGLKLEGPAPVRTFADFAKPCEILQML